VGVGGNGASTVAYRAGRWAVGIGIGSAGGGAIGDSSADADANPTPDGVCRLLLARRGVAILFYFNIIH